MRSSIRLLLSWILFALPVAGYAQAKICVSLFAAQSFSREQTDRAIAMFRASQHPCAAVLWRSFDRGGDFIERFLSLAREHTLEIHFSNEAGRRNRRLQGYEFLPRLSVARYRRALERGSSRVMRAVRREARSMRAFLDRHASPRSHILLSTGLEDNLSTPAWRRLASILRTELPGVRLVRSPLRAAETDGELLELHGEHPAFAPERACVVNNDGEDLRFPSRYIRRYRRRCELVMIWWGEAQGVAETWLPPRERVIKFTRGLVSRLKRWIKKYEL